MSRRAFTFSIFPKDDHAQALRIKRFFIAFASYVIFGALVDFSFALGLTPVPLHVLAASQSGILLCNVLIYVIFRTGLNKRFKDPSLTLPQILMATFWAMEVLYYADTTRGAALLAYLAIFIFGLFKLNVRQFLFLSFFTITGYAIVILLFYINHPESINVKNEILNIVVLTIVLPWFSLIGGYITRLKAKVSDAFHKIQETESKFGIIFNNASDGIIVVDIHNRKFSDGNEKMCNILGYTKEELLQLGIHDIHPSEAIPFVMEQFEKLLRKEVATVRNIPVLKKDKTQFFADISASTVIMGNNEYVVGMFRDITERREAEEKIRQSEKKYRTILEDMQEGYFEVDLAGNLTFFNDAVCQILGYSKEELTGMHYRQYTDKEESKKVYQGYHHVYRTGKTDNGFGWQIIIKDGTRRYIEGSVALLKDSAGNPVGFRGITRDITERKLMEDKLHREEQRFRALVEHSSDIIVVVNLKGTITYINPAVEQVLGYRPVERIGAKGFELVHPDDIQLLSDSFNILAADANASIITGEMRLRHKDGNWHTFEAIGSNLVNNHVVESVIINYRNITERKLAEEELRKSEQKYLELSIIDDLTKLYNSRHFYAQLEKEMERSKRYEQPLTLIMLDLDQFKIFNDKYGHVEGDKVLSQLGQAIKRCLRDPDSAFRYGGEEFTIILPMTKNREGFVTAERLQAEFRKEIFIPVPGEEIIVTMSIGIAQYQPEEDMKEFVHRVDQLMYQAKKNGKDMIVSESS